MDSRSGNVDIAVIKGVIAEQKLHAITPDEIGDDDDLIAGVAALDSLDCLNILVSLEQRFALDLENARIDGDTFRSVRSLAALVAESRSNVG